MGEGFLGTLWPVFGFAHCLGLFPCKRIRNEYGQIELLPISWKVQLILFILSSSATLGIQEIVIVYHGFSSGKIFPEIFHCLMLKFYGNESITDLFIAVIFFTIILARANLICFANYKMKEDLIDLSLQFHSSTKKKSLKSFYIIFIMMLIWSITVSIGLAWTSHECLSCSIPNSIILTFSIIIGTLWSLLPLLVFYGVAIEVFTDLQNEADMIQGDNFRVAK